MTNSQRGSHVLIVLIIIVVVGIIAVLGWTFISRIKESDQDVANTSQKGDINQLVWQQGADGWQAVGEAPDCPAQPMLKAPADLTKATSVLYPGQTRGQYKPHGGLRFDTVTDNKVTVTSPFDGYIIKASRNFAEGTTEVQYGFDIMNNCGVMVRFGHFSELPDNLQAVVSKLPEPTVNSTVENVKPAIYIKQGDVLATKVGLISEKNTFFDWGVYDYRQQNEASKSEVYKAAHPQRELAWYGVCWLQGWLPSENEEMLSALPAGGGENGKTSDYCR